MLDSLEKRRNMSFRPTGRALNPARYARGNLTCISQLKGWLRCRLPARCVVIGCETRKGTRPDQLPPQTWSARSRIHQCDERELRIDDGRFDRAFTTQVQRVGYAGRGPPRRRRGYEHTLGENAAGVCLDGAIRDELDRGAFKHSWAGPWRNRVSGHSKSGRDASRGQHPRERSSRVDYAGSCGLPVRAATQSAVAARSWGDRIGPSHNALGMFVECVLECSMDFGCLGIQWQRQRHCNYQRERKHRSPANRNRIHRRADAHRHPSRCAAGSDAVSGPDVSTLADTYASPVAHAGSDARIASGSDAVSGPCASTLADTYAPPLADAASDARTAAGSDARTAAGSDARTDALSRAHTSVFLHH